MADDRPLLFEPLTLRGLTARNRAWVPPMCQYSVETRDGVPNTYHLVHYGSLAIGGFGLIIAEASGVQAAGRISPFDLGLWDDAQVPAWTRIAGFVHAHGAAFGVQLGHAGFKASTSQWWPGVAEGVVPASQGGWEPVGPHDGELTALDGSTVRVNGLDEDGIARVISDFADAARRADAAGLDAVEIHGAHGYLLHEFYSPLTNRRTDRWGGDFEGRTRLVREVARAVRAVFPVDKPVLVRLTCSDWNAAGFTPEDSVRLAAALKEIGVDAIDASSGGLPGADIRIAPGYQVPLAERIRREAGVPTVAVGLIDDPAQAERILAEGSADAVDLGRAALRDTNWPLRAAHELGLPNAVAPWAPQHARGAWRR
ncbi:NADH:flavin oxidoreductase/NADH oxidase [uncultured Propionibacterium sp.]|uniref:NADH:flavin oxidoreductase/NADH oxidase n=1 Tax=uncultured Propionibacterium sp. TaxID=218066 RepID=UPI00292D2021|nr:NADH:flavin oxidoreductase/NADH oxidase [uncultured Propionibacterium sp.]